MSHLRYLLSSLFLLSGVVAQATSFGDKNSDPAFYSLLQEKLSKIPVFFSLPKSASAPTPQNEYQTSDRLFNYEHPQSTNAENPLGFRLYISKKDADLAVRLAESGFVQPGDVLITFRKEWGHTSIYPHIQMGQSHAGVAFVDEYVNEAGETKSYVRNLDQPLNSEFLIPPLQEILQAGHMEGGSYYKELGMLHIFRPRFMDAARKVKFQKWAKLIRAASGNIFPWVLNFNKNYLAPKLLPGDTTYDFVKLVGQMTLHGQDTAALQTQAKTTMFCSEFVWSLLSLSNCDPDSEADRAQILGDGPATCISAAFPPIPMIGDYISGGRQNSAVAGMADGPLMIIDSMNLSAEARAAQIESVFEESPTEAGMSQGQLAMVRKLKPVVTELQGYYTGAHAQTEEAVALKVRFNTIGPFPQTDNGFRTNNGDPVQFLPNYSPTSYGLNTLLPQSNANRVMDYVGTLTFQDSLN